MIIENSVDDFYSQRPLNTIRPVDSAFIKEVSEELNFNAGLSLNIDNHKILRVMRDVLKYVYDWYQYKSIIEKTAMVKQVDISASYGLNNGMYGQLRFPNTVHGIFNIQQATVSSYSLQTRILDIPILRATAFTSSTSIDINSLTYNNYRVSDATISLYEQSSYRTHFSKGIPFDFNNGTGEFILKTKINCDLVLGVFTKVDPSALYNDYYFKKHVVGQCMINAARIFGMFELKLAGGATINYSDLKDDGKDMVEECKEHYKETMATPKKLYK